MKPDVRTYSAEVGGKTVSVETGRLAQQAGGAVVLRTGDTQVFASATMNKEPREGINFFPLSVDYEERMYAGGKIPGGFFRREGRPSEAAILTARLTDRPLRPLFPKDMRNDVQVIMYSLSVDHENPIDVLAINAASAAVTISNIPWDGPVAAVRIGRINGEFVVNPTYSQMDESDLDLRVAGTKEALLMVEAGADQVSEEDMAAALQLAHSSMQPLIELQEKMRADVGKAKSEYPSIALDPEVKEKVYQAAHERLEQLFEDGKKMGKHELDDALNALRKVVVDELTDENTEKSMVSEIKEAFEAANKKVVRSKILSTRTRPDGRDTREVRPIWCEVGYSAVAHGSGIFTRGETQVLTLATLGTPRDAQNIDNLTPEDEKRYMHHYNFPPFSTGEVYPMRGPKRREIGHGALAERALVPVIPDYKDFPYTLRLVSECMSSNGSTSMGSVCGSTLALMDTGVPIKAPVSGIAMGMISDEDSYIILSDIQGLEDHLGDMDFKVAGTPKGITALQMDIKVSGLTPAMMTEALEQAKEGRAHILSKMMEVIPAPNPDLKPNAPRITTVQIPVDKIGALIGPGGKNIRALQEDTNTKIDIEEDGTVYIAATNGEDAQAAREQIEMITEEAELGRIYTGRVVRTTDFGAFVEILPGKDGMVHISQLDSNHVEKVEDVASVGDEITVMVTDVSPDGKVRLSRQAVLEGWTLQEAQERDAKKSGGGNRGGNRGGDRGGNRRSGGSGRGPRRD
jgi:polyribonucleotide nucleotidyltransferase